ncbi:MAG: 1-acyl-sn-glycerol-3-phosphate acyltransferase [Defluviicoccus sp.]|nr:1-acyl-sn-glycerol-3-phosphate acyltransferase [Defluviicoccus sp.]MDE0386232.1 1-acyl-sn-glycerol-3-phosphate acyltransferase [Defluviicoccus sp.]
MGELVALPVWLVVLVSALALLSLVGHFLMPGTRWVLRRRVYRVIEDVNSRLRIDLPPFMLTKRDTLIDRLIYDEKVLGAAAEAASERDVPQQIVVEEIRGYAEEIVPGFNAYFYFRLGYRLARRFIRFFYRVRLGYADQETLDRVDSGASLVLVMNHRSNFDYLLITYLASRRAALSYAAGEWTLFWPVANLLRAMGAYFVRRNSRNPLYRRVVERYVQLAVEGRVPQALFPEAGLSHDGGLRPPKAGLVDYIMRGFDVESSPDVLFIPVAINYERVVEDRTLLRHGDEAMLSQRGTVFVLRSTVAFFLRTSVELIQGRRQRFGRACANFGAPVSLKAWLAENEVVLEGLDRETRYGVSMKLVTGLMEEVGRLIPVLPVSLIATAMAENPDRALNELELKAGVHRLIGAFESTGAHVYVPFGEESLAVGDGLKLLLKRRILLEDPPGRYKVNPEERELLDFYVKPVNHLLPERGAAS